MYSAILIFTIANAIKDVLPLKHIYTVANIKLTRQ